VRLLLALAISAVLASPGSAKSARTKHTVEAGQTLWSIAVAYRVSVEKLMSHNDISDPTRLEVGQVLKIPKARVSSGRSAPKRRKSYSRHRRNIRLDWPVKGRITSRYGRRGRGRHNGLDVAATQGTIITAASGGRVVRDGGRWGRYGRVVLIEHEDGYRTLYAHLSRSFVAKSQTVVAGQAIGAVGATGNATGPHLHFEVWHGDKTIDPLGVLDSNRGRVASLR
jgi:murein DD-endopeptidase MepM/ murein hydrolase activator NlpD